jgi:TRAP-type C4-dicarboxylate transport system permease small subunit
MKGSFVLVAIVLIVLVGTIIGSYSQWSSDAEVSLGADGWIAMLLGTVFTLVIGCGLMALVFYSHHKGYDDDVK